jgi:hypothetical protein
VFIATALLSWKGGAGASLAGDVRAEVSHAVINEKRIVTLERKVEILETNPLDAATELRERLQPATRRTVVKMAEDVSLRRPYGLQMELLKQHIEWLNRGHTERQIIVVQAIVLAGAIRRAIEIVNGPTEEQKKHVGEIWAYKESGMNLLKEKLIDLGEVSDREMRFHL